MIQPEAQRLFLKFFLKFFLFWLYRGRISGTWGADLSIEDSHMAMTWLQQMFTPQGSGRYRWQGRPDQGGGEFTGEIEGVYEGDEQDLTFMPQAYTAQTGDGNPVGELDTLLEGMASGIGGASIRAPFNKGWDANEFAQDYLVRPLGHTMDQLSQSGTGIIDTYEDAWQNKRGGVDAWQNTGIIDTTSPDSIPKPLPNPIPDPEIIEDPMGGGVGGVRAADQRFSPPMPEDTITQALIEAVGNPKIHFNVADRVGTFSRSDLRPETSQAVTDRRADEEAFGARADARNMRKQPPGFWNWATGGIFGGPSQYMPSDWNINIPGKIHPGIDAQIAKLNEEAQVRIDREDMLRKRAMPEYMIRQIMGQHYRGLGPAGAL